MRSPRHRLIVAATRTDVLLDARAATDLISGWRPDLPTGALGGRAEATRTPPQIVGVQNTQLSDTEHRWKRRRRRRNRRSA